MNEDTGQGVGYKNNRQINKTNENRRNQEKKLSRENIVEQTET